MSNETMRSLAEYLARLRESLAEVAQREYDAWEQDADGIDPELGTGGICDRIAEGMAELIQSTGDVDAVLGATDGYEHQYVVAFTEIEACVVDIMYAVYETGGGFSWVKKPNVTITAEDVQIIVVNRQDVNDLLN